MKKLVLLFFFVLRLATVGFSQLNFQPSPISYPAKISWGTFMYSEQLFDNPDNWKFVRENMDIYLMHQQYWLNTNYLVYCKGPTAGKSRWAEFAKIIGNKPISLENAVYFTAWGVPTAADNQVADLWVNRVMTDQVTPMRNAGLNLTQLNIDMGPKTSLGGISRRHPDWNEDDLTALYGNGTAGGYTGTKPVGNGIWKSFAEKLDLINPSVSVNIVASPVYFDWKEPGKTPYTSISDHLTFSPLMNDAGTSPVLVNGAQVNLKFDGFNWFTSHFKGVSPTISTNFVSDAPYEYWNWTNIPVRDNFRSIIKAYENWLHQNGREHHLIVTGGATAAENPLNGMADSAYCSASQTVRDQLDIAYYNKSMQGIQLYQKLGIRADVYVVESWLKYPYDVANENKAGSFAKLGKDIINYVKGPNQKLDLTMVSPTNGFGNGVFEAKAISQKFADALPAIGAQKTYEFTFSNSSGITILPMLKMQQLSLAGTTVTVYDGTTNITSQILSVDGYTFPTQFVNPITTIKVVVSNVSKAINTEGGFGLWLYWNPQDPFGPRDAMAVTYNENAIINYWDFTSSTEGWNAASNMTMNASNSINTMTITADDPHVTSPDNLQLLTSQYKYVIISLQNQTSATSAELFWATTSDATFNGTKRISFPIVANDTKQRYYIVDLSTNTNWTGTIKQIRLDPTVATSGTVKVDFIKVTGAYPTNPASIPGIIQVENFNIGGDGNAYSDATPTVNSGNQYRTSEGVDISVHPQQAGNYIIGWTAPNEWLDYIVDIQKDSYYNISASVSSAVSTAKFDVLLNGESITPEIQVPNSGAYTTYQDITLKNIKLPIGLNVLRIRTITAGFNIDKLQCTDAVKTQTIALKIGWNLISTNVYPQDSSIATLFSGLDVQEIKTISSFWRKGQNTAFNSLQKITSGQGYLVKMNKAGTLNITGMPVETQNFASLHTGWQLIGCPFQNATTLTTYFNSSNCKIVKNFDGFWIPNGTTNSILTLEPGKAYYLKK